MCARRCLCGGVSPRLVLERQPLSFLLPVSKVHFYTDSCLGTAVYGVTQSQTQLNRLSSSSCFIRASLVAQTVKNSSAMWETWVRSLGGEDPLEGGMALHSSILAWRIPMDRGAWWTTVLGVAKSQTPLIN